MLSEMLMPGVVTYNTTLHGFFQTRRFSEAKEVGILMYLPESDALQRNKLQRLQLQEPDTLKPLG